MQASETRDLARYIVTTGKLIQEMVFQAQCEQLSSVGKRRGFKDISMPQFHTMMAVRRRGEVSITEMAELLKVSAPSASAMVDRLVEKGILVRAHSPSDRRRVLVSIAPDALEQIQQVEDAILQAFEGLLDKIGPETSRKWYDVLRKIKAALE